MKKYYPTYWESFEKFFVACLVLAMIDSFLIKTVYLNVFILFLAAIGLIYSFYDFLKVKRNFEHKKIHYLVQDQQIPDGKRKLEIIRMIEKNKELLPALYNEEEYDEGQKILANIIYRLKTRLPLDIQQKSSINHMITDKWDDLRYML